MPESDSPDQPVYRVDDVRDAIRLLEPVTRQNVALVALAPVLALRRTAATVEARDAVSRPFVGLPETDLDFLRDERGRVTPEFRIMSALRGLAGRGAELDAAALARGLRDDGDVRLRPRIFRARVLNQRGRVQPRGTWPELLAAHAQVVTARQVLEQGAAVQPRLPRLVEELSREPVNFHGALRAAETALRNEDARSFLKVARRDRRIALGVAAGETAAVAGGLGLAGWTFAVLPPGTAVWWALASLLPGGAAVVRELVSPVRLTRRLDDVGQAKGLAAKADAVAEQAWRQFVGYPTRTGPRRGR